MSAASDERAEGLAMLARLKRTRDDLAAKRKQLAIQCLDRRATMEDELALVAADTTLRQLQAQIEEGEQLLGIAGSAQARGKAN